MIFKKLRNSQNGMSILELLLLLLLILILILLGWYVWSQKDNSKQESSGSTPAKSEQKKEEPAKEQEQAAYLKIPEWGVKVKLSDQIKDAYYDNNISTEMEAFSLRVKSLDSEADCKNGPQSVAAIFKVKKDEIDPQYESENKKYSDTQKGATIGDSFYFINVAQYYCSEDQNVQTTLDKIRTAFTNATNDIEKL